MIVCDEIQPYAGTPWRGGRSCHLMSDTSVAELLEFATRIGLPTSWFQAKRDAPHFDLSPSWRARAIAAGAVSVTPREFVSAMRRYRAANGIGEPVRP